MGHLQHPVRMEYELVSEFFMRESGQNMPMIRPQSEETRSAVPTLGQALLKQEVT